MKFSKEYYDTYVDMISIGNALLRPNDALLARAPKKTADREKIDSITPLRTLLILLFALLPACGGEFSNTSDAETDSDAGIETTNPCQNYLLIDNFQDRNLTAESLGGNWVPVPSSASINPEADGLLVVGREEGSGSLSAELDINVPADIRSYDTLFVSIDTGYALEPEPPFDGSVEILMEGEGDSGPVSAKTTNPFLGEGELYLVFNYDMRDPNRTIRRLSKIKISIIPSDPTVRPTTNLFLKIRQVWFCQKGWEPELDP